MTRTYLLLASTAALMAIASPGFAKEQVRICSGAPDGIYAFVANQIKSSAKSLDVQVSYTTGTSANIQNAVQLSPEDPEACDVFVGQPDGPVWYKRNQPAVAAKIQPIGVPLHREYLQAVCNKDVDVDDIGDLENDPKGNNYSIAVGAEGSGTWLVWQNFIAEDDDYEAITALKIGDKAALDAVVNGTATCAIFMSALKSGTMQAADQQYGDYLKLVGVNDTDFNDATDIKGKPLYTYQEIPGDTYETSLQKGWGGAVDTVTANASVYYNVDRVSPAAQEALRGAILQVAPLVRGQYGK